MLVRTRTDSERATDTKAFLRATRSSMEQNVDEALGVQGWSAFPCSGRR